MYFVRSSSAAVLAATLLATSCQANAAYAAPPPKAHCEANRVAAEAAARAAAQRAEAGSGKVIGTTALASCGAYYLMFGGTDAGLTGFTCTVFAGLVLWGTQSAAAEQAAKLSYDEYRRVRDPRCSARR